MKKYIAWFIAVGMVCATPVYAGSGGADEDSSTVCWFDRVCDKLTGGDSPIMQIFAGCTNSLSSLVLLGTAAGAAGYTTGQVTALFRHNIWPAIKGKNPETKSGLVRLGKAFLGVACMSTAFYLAYLCADNGKTAFAKLIK